MTTEGDITTEAPAVRDEHSLELTELKGKTMSGLLALCQELGVQGTSGDKEVRLEIRGADTELDKLIVEQLVDPQASRAAHRSRATGKRAPDPRGGR